MKDEDLAGLERLAREAVPGPWRACGADRNGMPSPMATVPLGKGESCTCRQVWSTSADALVAVASSAEDNDADGEGVTPEAARATARYIAAAHPSAVLALIEHIRHLEEGIACNWSVNTY